MTTIVQNGRGQMHPKASSQEGIGTSVHDKSNGDSFARSGELEVRLAVDPAEIELAQNLRYRVFYEEMSAVPSAEMKAAKRDFDRYDDFCDHLLVIDHRAEADEAVVGCYRLLRQSVAEKNGGFYTASEYDIGPLLERASSDTKFLELGRSCVREDYRTRPTVELLWKGIMAYVAKHDMDVMFGCASFDGTDPDSLALPLSFLHHEFSAPEPWKVRALEHLRVEMNRMPKEEISLKGALRALPPLIRGYVRAGAYIGDGAVIDEQFGTTDVLIMFPVSELEDRYKSRFGKSDDT